MPTRRVASVHKIRRIVWESRSITNLNFRVADNVALDSARTIWETVSADGGHGTIDNLFILRGKDEAMKLIQDKIRRLRGWLDHVDGQIAHLESDVKKLEELLDSGGPHLPPSHETVRLDGPVAFIDIDQVGDHEVIEEHISDIQSRYSIASPGYPEPSNGYHSEEQHQMRERADQRALARFNIMYLKMKIRTLQALRKRLIKGIAAVKKFTSLRTWVPRYLYVSWRWTWV
ncbi:uncharacterized protein LOC107304076 [Oryza brachyantha]|uniref:uncharacterized protein LOC107304076 n=1 Tax=Oryza brachyantha TaxID=4533 RepID=UPI0007760706|nr:uncharacterized protein LOC107304076 [Oryza brachyantha]